MIFTRAIFNCASNTGSAIPRSSGKRSADTAEARRAFGDKDWPCRALQLRRWLRMLRLIARLCPRSQGLARLPLRRRAGKHQDARRFRQQPLAKYLQIPTLARGTAQRYLAAFRFRLRSQIVCRSFAKSANALYQPHWHSRPSKSYRAQVQLIRSRAALLPQGRSAARLLQALAPRRRLARFQLGRYLAVQRETSSTSGFRGW